MIDLHNVNVNFKSKEGYMLSQKHEPSRYVIEMNGKNTTQKTTTEEDFNQFPLTSIELITSIHQ